MKLTTAISQYLDTLKGAKSKATVAAYGSDLNRLARLASPDTVLRFTVDLVTRYFVDASSQDFKMSTLARKHAAINGFAEWGVRQKYWPSNPMDAIPRPSPPENLPRPFNPAERDALMTLTLPPVQHALRALLYYTGLRVTPICDIRVGDCSFAPITFVNGVTMPGSIRTTGKGGVRQVIPMHPALHAVLGGYLREHPELKSYDPLVGYANRRPFRRKTIEKFTRAWGVAVGVPNCIPHRFRHTFASDLLAEGHNPRVIQVLLGHRDIKTTMLYTKVHDPQATAAVLTLPTFDTAIMRPALETRTRDAKASSGQ